MFEFREDIHLNERANLNLYRRIQDQKPRCSSSHRSNRLGACERTISFLASSKKKTPEAVANTMPQSVNSSGTTDSKSPICIPIKGTESMEP